MNNDFNTLHTIKQSDITEYYSFYDKDGNYLNNVTTVSISPTGQFENITVKDTISNESIIYSKGEYTYITESIYVLGIGYLIPCDIVKLSLHDKTAYELHYGWHTNISNQNLFSWYLIPIDIDTATKEITYKTNSPILTLYKEHLETIEVVLFAKDRATFHLCDKDFL